MGLRITTQPSAQPLRVEEVKEYLRIDAGDNSQDQTISLLIKAARRTVEEYTRQSIISQTFTWDLDSDDAKNPIWIPRGPVTSITSLKTYDESGTETTVNSANYELVERSKLVARADGWSIDSKERAAELIYVAGAYTDSTDTPDDIKLAMLKIIATHYESREDDIVGTVAGHVTNDWQSLLDSHRVYGV